MIVLGRTAVAREALILTIKVANMQEFMGTGKILKIIFEDYIALIIILLLRK